MKQLTALVLILSFGISTAFAQNETPNRIGYVDINYVFNNLPAAKQIETKVNKYYEQIQANLSQKYKEYEKKQRELESMDGQVPASVREDKMTELRSLTQRIQAMEQNANSDFEEYKNEQLEPVFKKIKVAIKDVADVQGFDYILNGSRDDQSIIILYARDETNDISDLVLEKMGVDPSTIEKTSSTTGTSPAGSGIPIRK